VTSVLPLCAPIRPRPPRLLTSQCAAPFDNRTSTEVADDGSSLNKIVLQGTAYNYTPSAVAAGTYGVGVPAFMVGDSM
jgi:hypothetical protein